MHTTSKWKTKIINWELSSWELDILKQKASLCAEYFLTLMSQFLVLKVII